MNNYRLIAYITLLLMLMCLGLCHECMNKNKPIDINNKVKIQEAKKDTIKAKIMIEESKVIRVKEQQATIKKRLQVAKKGLILEVESILDDTSKVEQVIEVINTQGLLISCDSGIIALQDTIIDHYKQLDSNNTNIIVELKEDRKKEQKKAKRKGFWNGVKTSIGVAIVIGIAKAVSMIF